MASEPKDTTVFSLSMLQQVINYIEENLLEELTPAKVAAYFYISESTLSAMFKIVCNMTIMEYVRNRRLSLATKELSTSNIPIIELAYHYGYETPEAFTKAFSRFHGFPPSCIRRGFPVTKFFSPLEIEVSVQGGWHATDLTKSNGTGQDRTLPMGYTTFITKKGGHPMENQEISFRVDTGTMRYTHEWSILSSLAKHLLQTGISFKVDGKTMIFAHGLEIPLDKICLTFKWNDEETVKEFFHSDVKTEHMQDGFKYFDATYEDTKIRCMFYGNCPGDDTNEFLYSHTDLVQVDSLLLPVQSLEFYYENAEKNTSCYKLVEEWLKEHERL